LDEVGGVGGPDEEPAGLFIVLAVAGGDQGPVGIEGDAIDAAGVAGEGALDLAGGEVPEGDGLGIRAGGEAGAVGAEGEAGDAAAAGVGMTSAGMGGIISGTARRRGTWVPRARALSVAASG
jgi:hypothetical protein